MATAATRTSGKTRANQNKAFRQEALREQLASQGHLQHIIELHKQLQDLDTDMDATQVQRLRAVMDSKHKLIDKYLPTVKPVEHSGAISNPEAELKTALQLLARFGIDTDDVPADLH